MNLEIDITLECNLKCAACNRLCDQVPKNPLSIMTLDDIKMIYDEIKDYRFSKYIAIIGGEPTTNPYLMDILDWLDQQKFNIDTGRILVVTNGINKDVIKTILDRKYKQIYVDFMSEEQANYWRGIYGNYDKIVSGRRGSFSISDRKNVHYNFLYGEPTNDRVPYNKCGCFKVCGKGIFKLHGKIYYYHNTACKSICILLGKEHYFKEHFRDLFNDQDSFIKLNDEICPYCMMGRKHQIRFGECSKISDIFLSGLDNYKQVISQEINGAV